MLISFIWELIRPMILRQRGQLNWLEWDSVTGKDRLQTGPSELVLTAAWRRTGLGRYVDFNLSRGKRRSAAPLCNKVA